MELKESCRLVRGNSKIYSEYILRAVHRTMPWIQVGCNGSSRHRTQVDCTDKAGVVMHW